MIKKVREFIVSKALIAPGDIIVLGVSGGPDSMALLHIMKEIQAKMDFTIIAAHLNHSLRAEADDEETFVKKYCDQWGVPFYSKKADIREAAQKGNKSLEEAGRDERYNFFRELMQDLGADRIATAHHQDDVAETVLHHLLRGTGIKGLRGIMPVNGDLIRPLLCVAKNDILRYLEENSLEYCTDMSNFEVLYMRNKIRHKLIPYLQTEFNPRIIESLNQLADIAREENEAMELMTLDLWKEIVLRSDSSSVVLNNQRLLETHPACQRRLIRKALQYLKGESGWDMKDIQYVTELMHKPGSSKTIKLAKGIYVNKVYEELFFTCEPVKRVSYKYEVSVPGRLFIPETGDTYNLQIVNNSEFTPQPDVIYLDYDKLKKPLYIRSRCPGDIFRPLGLKGSKKLKDFFIDIKLPQAERDVIPLLASDDEIYAVLGLRTGQRGVVDEHSQRIIVIERLN